LTSDLETKSSLGIISITCKTSGASISLDNLSNNFDLAMAKESLFALDSFIKTLYHGHNGYPTTANISTLNCSLLN